MARNYEKHQIAETTRDIATIAICLGVLGVLAVGIEGI